MAVEQGDRYSSIEAPLLNDEKVNDGNTTTTKDQQHLTVHHVANASSFKTCFHLLNAISGSTFILSSIICFFSSYFYLKND